MKLLAGGIVVAAFAILSPLAWGQTMTTFTGTSPATFETGSNYDNGAPNAGNGPVFPVSDSTIVINQSNNDTIPSLTVGGTGELDFNSNGKTLDVTGATPVAGTGNISVFGGVNFVYSGGGTLELRDGIFDVNGGSTVTLNDTTKFNYDYQTTADDTQLNIGNGSGGTFTQTGTSTVTTGNSLFIGSNGGVGTYNLTSGSTLQTGSNLLAGGGTYFIIIGSDSDSTVSGTVGTLNISGATSVLDLNPGSEVDLGQAVTVLGSGNPPPTSVQSEGIINQTGSGSVVNITGSSSNDSLVLVGRSNGATGIYNFKAGTINMNDDGGLEIGVDQGSTGRFNQSGGTFNANTANSSILVGVSGNGTYTLSGGTDNFDGAFFVGGLGTTGSGTFNMSNGAYNSGVDADFEIGGGTGSTPGTFNLSGGTATLNDGLTVNSTGTVNQTGGTLIIVNGNTLDLTSQGAVYNLNGGTLEAGGVGAIDATGNTGNAFNFGGGTLLSTGVLTVAANGTVSNTSTLNATGGNITLSGTLTNGANAGGFNIASAGANTVTLLVPKDSFTGATTISGGSLILSNNGNATATYDSSVQGTSGMLRVAASGATLRLAAAPVFTGTTTIVSGGTLQLENPSATLAYNATLGSIAPSTGSLIVGDNTAMNPVTLNLVGTNSYTGTTTINENSTLLANSLDSTSVVAPGTIGSNSPVQAPIAPFVIGGPVGGTPTGNLTQSATSGMLIRVQGNSAFDSFHVAGASTGATTTEGTVTVTGYSSLGTTAYPIVIADGAGAVATGISELGQTSNSTALLLTNVTTQAGTHTGTTQRVLLNVTQLPITTYANTPNEMAIANSLDSALVNPPPGIALFTAIDSLTAAQIPQALDALIPVNYLYMRDIAFENSTFLANKLDNSLANLRSGYSGLDTSGLSMVNPGMGSSLGRSLNSMLAFNNEGPAPNGVDYYPSDGTSPVSPAMEPTLPGVPEGTPTAPGSISDTPVTGMTPTASPPPPSTIFDGVGQGFNEFISGDVILADLNENASNSPTPKATYTAADATGGVSFRVTSNLAVGALFDYNHTDASVDSVNSHIRVDTYSPGVFATFFEKGFYANGLFAFGYNNYSNDRNIDFGGVGTTAISRPSGEQYVFNLDGGYDFHPDPHWVLGPTIGAEYTHLDVDGFDESGAGTFDENIGAQSADSLRGRIGGHVIYQIQAGNFLFQPNFTLAFQREFLDDSFGLTGTPNIPGASAFTISGTNPGRNSALIGAGVTATIDNQFNFFLNYLAEVGGDDYFVQSAEGGFKATF